MYITYLLFVVADRSIGWNFFISVIVGTVTRLYILMLISCVLNGMIVLVFIKTKELHTLHFLFIFLFLGLLHLYFSLNEWQLNDLNK